jgi:hypothetical protein
MVGVAAASVASNIEECTAVLVLLDQYLHFALLGGVQRTDGGCATTLLLAFSASAVLAVVVQGSASIGRFNSVLLIGRLVRIVSAADQVMPTSASAIAREICAALKSSSLDVFPKQCPAFFPNRVLVLVKKDHCLRDSVANIGLLADVVHNVAFLNELLAWEKAGQNDIEM